MSQFFWSLCSKYLPEPRGEGLLSQQLLCRVGSRSQQTRKDTPACSVVEILKDGRLRALAVTALQGSMRAGRVIRCSDGPEPFPGVPIKEPLQPQQPGEVLIRYELEAASGCQLTALGWCCFGTLCCVALPLSWLPFVCAFCKNQYQRPVYGYPMDCLTVSFIAAAAEDACSTQKASTAVNAPAIHCMDASLLEPLEVQQDQQQQRLKQQQQQDASAQLRGRVTSTPPPISIFIPPSAVPACGFTADNPFPCRYSPAASCSPKAPLMFGAHHALRTSSPMSGAGLPVVGMVDLEQHRRQLELQELQLQQEQS